MLIIGFLTLKRIIRGVDCMLKKICNLIDVKSLVTIALTGVFSVLSVQGRISAEQFLTVFTVVISFYFGTQYQKYNSKEEK